MPLQRTGPVEAGGPLYPRRPNWLTAGLLRLGILCLFIVLIGMIRSRIDHDDAGIVLLVGLCVIVAGALGFFLYTRRVA